MKQLITYFCLTYLITWIIWLPLYGHIFGLNNLPLIPFNHYIGELGPLIAAFVTTWIFLKNDGIKSLFTKCFQTKPLIYLIVAILSPFLLTLLAVLLSYFINQTLVDFSGLLYSKEFLKFDFITYFFFNLLFIGFGEEVGWRGFALPRLLNKSNVLVASIILTLFWALWHLPLFYYRPGFTSMEWTGILAWFFSLLTGSILQTWLYVQSKGSILICAVFHTTINIVFTADFGNKNIINYTGFLITVWGILTAILILQKPKLANNLFH
jgi:uncharacterized protein